MGVIKKIEERVHLKASHKRGNRVGACKGEANYEETHQIL